MARQQSTAEDFKSGSDLRADFYTGTKEDLIAAAVCKREWFPEALIPEFCKDGRPKMGNSGRQRFQRTYRVESASPAIELTHRRDAQGREYWVARKEVTKQEAERRRAQYKLETERQSSEYEKGRREREEREALAAEAARPAVSQLRKRYPSLPRIDGEIYTREDGTRFQRLTFYARSIEVLRKHDLVTEEICSIIEKEGRSWGDLKGGGSFIFFAGNDAGGAYCYITLDTEESPKERKQFPVTEARALLKRLAGGT